MDSFAISPVHFRGMLLAAMGADGRRFETMHDPGIGKDQHFDVAGRGKRSVAVNLQRPQHIAQDTHSSLIAVQDPTAFQPHLPLEQPQR